MTGRLEQAREGIDDTAAQIPIKAICAPEQSLLELRSVGIHGRCACNPHGLLVQAKLDAKAHGGSRKMPTNCLIATRSE